MSLQNEFGRIVQEKRAEKDYTQQALAELADITVRHMHTVEYGEAEVGLRTATALADILDIDLNILKHMPCTMLTDGIGKNMTKKAQPTSNRILFR